MKMCFNWKVVAGLAVVGFVVWAAAPSVGASALPVLLMLACPLSMLFMGRSMMGGRQTQTMSAAQPGQYTCSMHPDVVADQPGRCPKCGMTLGQVPVPVQPVAPVRLATPATPDDGALSREEQLAQLRARLQTVGEQQEALAREIAAIEAAEAPAVRQAEAVAQAAEQRGPARP